MANHDAGGASQPAMPVAEIAALAKQGVTFDG